MKMKRRGFLKALFGSWATAACVDMRKAAPPAPAALVDKAPVHVFADETDAWAAVAGRVRPLAAQDIAAKNIVFVNSDGRVGIGHCPTEGMRIEAGGLYWSTGQTPSQPLVIKS